MKNAAKDSKKQPKVVSGEKASSLLKVTSNVRAGLVISPIGGGCRTCGLLGHFLP